jgi:hypothetical protein
LGAHFNPAITVAMLAIRQIRAREAAAYIVFQLIGGALAGLLVLLLFHHAGVSVRYGATAIDAKVIPDGPPWPADRRGDRHVHPDLGCHGRRRQPTWREALRGTQVRGLHPLAEADARHRAEVQRTPQVHVNALISSAFTTLDDLHRKSPVTRAFPVAGL